MGTRPRLPAWVAYALGSFFCYGITNSLLGALVEWSDHNPDTPITAPFVLWMTMGFAGVGAAVVFKVRGRGYRGLPSRKFMWIAAIAGVTVAAGMLTLKLGLSSDSSARGPIVAITSANAMLVALGAWIFIREKLSPWQLLGMLAIVGIVLLSLGGARKAKAPGLVRDTR